MRPWRILVENTSLMFTAIVLVDLQCLWATCAK